MARRTSPPFASVSPSEIVVNIATLVVEKGPHDFDLGALLRRELSSEFEGASQM